MSFALDFKGAGFFLFCSFFLWQFSNTELHLFLMGYIGFLL